jgi:predicted transcriptional regulator
VASTTVQLSREHRDTLAAMKLHPRETLDDVVGRVLEDLEELDRATVRAIAKARREIAAGRSISHEKLGEKMGF